MGHQQQTDRPTDREIVQKYSEVDADDVAENAVDYFEGTPDTESEKSEDSR